MSNGLPPVMYLNRDDRDDRRGHMKRQLTELGFEHVRVSAPIYATAGRFQTIAARGSWMSHVEMLEMIARDGREFIVMEDDVVIHDVEAMRDAIAFVHAMGEDWAFLYFYGAPNPTPIVQPVKGVLNVHAQLVNPRWAGLLSLELRSRYIEILTEGNKDLNTYVDQYIADVVQNEIPVFWGTRELVTQDYDRFGSDTNWRNHVKPGETCRRPS